VSDTLFIDIDLTALDAALDRLSTSMGMGTGARRLDPHIVGGLAEGQTTLGGQLIGGYGPFIRMEMEKEYKSRIFPAINRDLRIILSEMGLGPAVRASFFGRRVERGIGLGGPEMYLAIAASLILLWQMVHNHARQLEQMNEQYEASIRSITGATQKQYDDWIDRFGGKPFKMGVQW